MVNKDFVKMKISLIEEEMERLKEYSKFSFQEIVTNFSRQATVERLLERIINRAIDINQHLIAEFLPEEMQSPKSYRETFSDCLKDYHQYCDYILKFIENQK